jgi:hypothetical protein
MDSELCARVWNSRIAEVWKAVTMDKSSFLDNLIALLSERQIRYCVIVGVSTPSLIQMPTLETPTQ